MTRLSRRAEEHQSFSGDTSQGSSTQIETTAGEKENKATFELAGAINWDVSGGAPTYAPNLAMEIEPIENRLELETGVSPFFTRTATEWDTDLLFKKRWTLSRKAEFMLGIGPEWVHLKQSGRWANTVSAEIAADFMFWPNRKHRFDWFLEPAFDYSFAGHHEKSIGMSFGLLIGVR
ncbi:MAG TPA: hypothetical protein VG273_02600 [Bryobacteraceae bacterium]|nr:hypothetical protein [Bryobacteraceae bacterium]